MIYSTIQSAIHRTVYFTLTVRDDQCQGTTLALEHKPVGLATHTNAHQDDTHASIHEREKHNKTSLSMFAF